jgi:hypothetical protein
MNGVAARLSADDICSFVVFICHEKHPKTIFSLGHGIVIDGFTQK